MANRPKVDPTPGPGINRPPANSNQRPSVLPSRPDTPNLKPNLPSTLPATKPNLPSIGQRPNLPDVPNRPPVQFPSKPDVRPNPLPDRPKIDPKIDPKLPIGPDRPNRPGIDWPNRPGPGPGPGPGRPGGGGIWDRPSGGRPPGFNNNGDRNTIVNKPVNSNNKTNVTQINQSNNYYNNSTNVFRGGYGGYGWNTFGNYHAAWNNNYNYWHQAYHPWYHGCWHGNAFDTWGVGAVGLLASNPWGLNSLSYMFGYTPYVNPFYVAPAPTVVVPQYLNYSQPVTNVVQAVPESGKEPPPLPPTAAETFDMATAAFKKGDYRTALTKTEQAMKDFPNDPVMHEFRALCLFALGDYRQASAAIHSVLASGPGWDWTTLSSLYPDTATYSGQLAALQKATAAKPDDPALQFLLAYHAMTAGDAAGAKDALEKAHKLLPNDSVTTQLWRAAGGTDPAPKVAPPKAAEVDLDLKGNWTATRPDGGTIGLGINADGTFTWTVQDKGGKKDSFDGTFTVEEDTLVLERKAGGALIGRVTPLAANGFNFKVIGGGDADPGLNFKK